MIECRKCGVEQAPDEFYLSRQSGKRRGWCRICVIDNVKQWQRENPDRHYKKQRRSDLKRRFGLSEEDLKRMREAQGFRCAICGSPERPEARLVIDHCHASGRVRGLLCHLCNVGLGLFEDDVDKLYRAVTYLDH